MAVSEQNAVPKPSSGRKIRVLQTELPGTPGGIKSYILNHYEHLDKTRFQLDFTTSEPQADDLFADLIAQGSHIYTVPRIRQRRQRKAAYEQLFAEQKYDVVHIPKSYIAELDLVRLAKRSGAKVILHAHSSRVETGGLMGMVGNLLHHRLRRKLSRYVDVFAACSSVAANWMFGTHVLRENIRLLHNAVAADRFRFDAEVRRQVREHYHIPDDALVMGHVGRFCYPKNHEFIIEIFRELHQLCPTAKLWLVGNGENEQIIRNAVAESDFADAVRFFGVRNDVHRLMQAMDAFVLPSRFEGLPLVGVEAQAADLPCFFSDAVTPEAAVIPNTVTYLPLSDSPKTWAKAILAVQGRVRTDRVPEVVAAGYDLEQQAQEMDALYTSLAERKE